MRDGATPPRRQVLILADHYLPGQDGGGPIRTLSALVERLGGHADFRVLTRDRDLGATHRYPGIVAGEWRRTGAASCLYVAPGPAMARQLLRALRDTPYDVVYVNTLFSIPFALYPRLLQRARLVPPRPTIVAPRGQLDPSALALKRTKKLAFIAATRALRLFRRVAWQATNEDESRSIRRWYGRDADVHVVPNMRRARPRVAPAEAAPANPGGTLRIAFVSRISPKKNLAGALEILAGVRCQVQFDVFGPREDERYWRRCLEVAARLPSNVALQYRGVLPHAEVEPTLARYDLLLLPTLGENYGHVIAEALAAGCPPLVSDRTPWRGLAERDVGWDVPVAEPDRFRRVIEDVARESPERRRVRAQAAARWMASLDAAEESLVPTAQMLGVAIETAPLAAAG